MRPLSLKQGRPLFGVDLRIVDAEGQELPCDGDAAGDAAGQGPVGLRDYFRSDGRAPLDADGWFHTGDVAHDRRRRLSADHRPLQGRDQVGRRVDQLDRAREHRRRPPGRRRGRGDRRARIRNGTSGRCCWSSSKTGATVTRDDDARRSTTARSPSWWMPDDVVFVDELPHTATGKLSRRRCANGTATTAFPPADLLRGRSRSERYDFER